MAVLEAWALPLSYAVSLLLNKCEKERFAARPMITTEYLFRRKGKLQLVSPDASICADLASVHYSLYQDNGV